MRAATLETPYGRLEARARALRRTVLALASLACALSCGGSGRSPKPAEGAWRLSWSDEFNGREGAPPDPKKWTLETGVGEDGWGNQELEYYTGRSANVRQAGGRLVIAARRERFAGPGGVVRDFTSARLKTQGKFEQAYGRFEARIRLPRGRGLWPAFWLLGGDVDKAGWPACGEIDVMENVGGKPDVVLGTIHGPGYSGDAGLSRSYREPGRKPFADAFHVYAVEWEPREIRFYVDGALTAARTPRDLPAGAPWPFDHPFFIVLNLAVGGHLPGPPGATTAFPREMLVDYVRVYARRASE